MGEPRGASGGLELQQRLGRFRELLAEYPRIALGGGAERGKTLVFAPLCTDRLVVHTDDWLSAPYDAVPGLANAACAEHSRFLIEGVRVVGCIRAGLEVDVLVWLTKALGPVTPKQASQALGRETDLKKLLRQHPGLNVVRL